MKELKEQNGKPAMDPECRLGDPASRFSSPLDVVDDPTLSLDEKLCLLRQWERDVRALDVAEEENMGGGETVLLSSVLDALRCLGAGPGPARSDASKH